MSSNWTKKKRKFKVFNWNLNSLNLLFFCTFRRHFSFVCSLPKIREILNSKSSQITKIQQVNCTNLHSHGHETWNCWIIVLIWGILSWRGGYLANLTSSRNFSCLKWTFKILRWAFVALSEGDKMRYWHTRNGVGKFRICTLRRGVRIETNRRVNNSPLMTPPTHISWKFLHCFRFSAPVKKTFSRKILVLCFFTD